MGCCSGDADDKELATVDPDIKKEAEEELEKEEEYEPSGSGRIPGSKYTIGKGGARSLSLSGQCGTPWMGGGWDAIGLGWEGPRV